ncbi:MAG TPA: DUF3450 family protein [Campylobacterales bacterium]|nr:DUF3450 family protein [Campylobacterales bacterium]HHD80237.1 DUF3450 family protein [Campylobacterales bacterium]HHH51234.1 DUF3450 family protein [Campylobacterales bacterium]
MLIQSKRVLRSIVVSGLLGSTSLYANSNDNIVKSIMKLRAEVEALYTKIDDNKDAYKSEMKSLTMQSTDNEAQINRQETALKLSNAELEKVRKKIAELSSKNESIKPMLLDALNSLEKIIKNGIPFKTTERLSDINKIRTQLDKGDITEEKALSMIWASYDDTIRLTKEIGLFKQEIVVDGETKLAKIAKLGSIMMYFAIPDDKVGYVVKNDNNQYSYKTVTQKEEVEKIVNLFDSLKKQIRTGYFSLPNALILSEAN